MEELTENAEEPDDGDSKKEEQKLGKLQYKVGRLILLKDKWRMKAVQRTRCFGTITIVLSIIVFSFNIKFIFLIIY